MSSIMQFEAAMDVLGKKRMDLIELLSTMKEQQIDLEAIVQVEKKDVDVLESDGFKATLFRILHIYEGRLTAEHEQYLKAKMVLENHLAEMEPVERQLKQLEIKIDETYAAFQNHKKELATKQQTFETGQVPENLKLAYDERVADRKTMQSQLVEIEEAVEACACTIATMNRAKKLLDSADGWSFLDTWGGGGFFTDMMKYEKLELLQEAFREIEADLNRLNRELADLGELPSFELTKVDSTTKFFDIWFDNIFTDLQVREQIKKQKSALIDLESNLEHVESTLANKLSDVHQGLSVNQEAVERLLMEV